MRIFYWVPAHSTPSWGIGLLHTHVGLLREAGFEAAAVSTGVAPSSHWLDGQGATVILDDPALELTERDVLVLPEVLAPTFREVTFPGRVVLFVQGTAPLISSVDPVGGLTAFKGTHDLRAMTILPHLQALLHDHYDLEAALVPPCLAAIFTETTPDLEAARERTVLLHVKDDVDTSGFPGRAFLEALWEKRAPTGWRLELLQGLTQAEVAAKMRSASLFVNLNLIEAFNTTVPEAMACGCNVLCYWATGGHDFLVSGDTANAGVFDTGDISSLASELFALLQSWDEESTQSQLSRRRARALHTVRGFSAEATRSALLRFFEQV